MFRITYLMIAWFLLMSFKTFPAGKQNLDTGITEFVTQHRHRGIDIVAMGQDHRDCHMLWKRGSIS